MSRRTAGDRTINLVLGSSTGGIGAHIATLVSGLGDAGWDVRVAGPAATDELFGFTRLGARFAELPLTGPASQPRAVLALRRIVGDSALVHAHGLRAGLVAAAGAGVRARHRPLVVTWHNAVLAPPGPARAVLAGGERTVARAAAITLAASKDLAARARQLGGRDVRYAPVALPVIAATRSPEQTRTALGIGPDQPVILAVGRLHDQKGHDLLIDAAAGWGHAGWGDNEVVVLIAGDGPRHDELARRIAARRAPVRLLGRRADVPDLLAAADLVVLPSRWEARALVAQQALLAGRPLVATAVGGLPDLLGSAARLIPAADVDALDRAVRELLADPAARAELSRRALEQAATWPRVHDTVAQVDAVYRELLGRRSGPAG